jgi:hypothetical protein
MAIKVSGTSVINDSRRLENIASVDSTTAASMTAAGVGGTPSGTNVFDAPVKGDGSGGLRFAGYNLGSGGAQYVSGSGTYTVPSNTPYVKVFVTGGGGGGSGASPYQVAWFNSGGGGASSTIYGFIAVNTGDSITYSVGAKGNKGSGQSLGTNGGTSTLTKGSTTLTATGGAKGNNGSHPGTGGAAGTASSTGSLLQEEVVYAGNAGGNPNGFTGGSGGASYYGQGAQGILNTNADNAVNYGSGGAGGASNSNAANGSDGASGYIVIERWSAIE